MNSRILAYIFLVLILSVSLLCVFCPLIASASTASEEFDDFSSIYVSPAFALDLYSVGQLIELTDKAYDIGLFGGAMPLLTAISEQSRYIEVVAISPWAGTENTPVSNVSITFNGFYMSCAVNSGAEGQLLVFRLGKNGTWKCFDTYYNAFSLAGKNAYVIFDNTTGTYRQVTNADYSRAPETTNDNIHLGIDNILGAYDRILAGSTVGGDEYDDGYNAGYGYGYDVGYDAGYETGYDDGWETGYDVGFEHGVDTGKGIGYTEGYDDGYETGYDDGWDDGYDDGYVMGELEASPITIDVPSVITSVPQSAKAIINNAFGFELFGINVAGLLSVLLIVAIIGFVVKWLMSR